MVRSGVIVQAPFFSADDLDVMDSIWTDYWNDP
jgi:hypothetical protein